MSAKLPPLMLQYRQTKSAYPDAILFFQVGDFYEMFYDDAVTASKVLELTLTARDKNGANPVPLCGFPIHAADNYLGRLIRAGHNVAVCNQMEPPSAGKSIVRREVVRVITPGTLLEDHLLNGGQANYLAAVCGDASAIGLAYVDVSTGDFRLLLLSGPEATTHLEAELTRIECRELLIPEDFSGIESGRGSWSADEGVVRPAREFDPKRGARALCAHLGVNRLSGYGVTKADASVGAAAALLAFLQETQKGALPQITALKVVSAGSAMVLDKATQRNLELTRRLGDDSRQGTLLALLDRTGTSMGSRQLKDWLTGPLLGVGPIARRHDAVAWAVAHPAERDTLADHLKKIADLERLGTRVAMGRTSPRELAALGGSLQELPPLGALLPVAEDASAGQGLLAEIAQHWDNLDDVCGDIAATLADELPVHLKDGGVIRSGVSRELDELRAVGSDVRGTLARMEATERQRTGVESLKIRHNNVFGYYIEITKAKLAETSVPYAYVRKQTLVNAERFITPELKELESKIFSAAERIERLENELFSQLRERVAGHVARIQWSAAACGTIDVLVALAQVAHEGGWVRPEMSEDRALHIDQGAHPTVAAQLAAGSFICNDTNLPEEAPVWIVTGPNMAGKSTFLRQVALICLMAQMGSYVPAAAARIGVVDRIFSRIGASDNVSEGLSTFMVEMTETASILHSASPRSLVILDEIGRGTSTFDGLSIAWAVAEFLHNGPACRTLFATHYHELTELSVTLDGVKNVNVQVREWNDEIVFLHKIVAGGADRSYGIQVARLAGLPLPVIDRARQVLANLEGGELTPEGQPRIASDPDAEADGEGQINLFAAEPHPALDTLKNLDLSNMTPMDAMNTLYRLQRSV